MSPDFVALRPNWSADEAIAFLRGQRMDVNQPFYLYVVDSDGRLLGVVSLRGLIVAPPETPIAELLSEAISVRTGDDQELAAERMRHYNLLALPVVDAEERLRGVISADDVLDVQVEEATEDMFRMAGLGVKERAFSPVLESAGRRVPWLAFNMLWAFAGALIISAFQGTLERVAALAIFMPMIAGQAGNAGIQTATIVVRSMALGELDSRDGLRLLRKEWALGLIKGVLFGSVLGLVAWIWQDDPEFGLIAGAAMFLNMLVASTTGVVIPLTLRRIGVDPATIAGVFDTMVTDLMGFLIYLGLATLLITQIT
jgi:magnesium transporter